jgi:hypothetical protein
MGPGEPGPELGGARLQRHDRHAPFERPDRRVREGGHVGDAFDVERNGGDARVLGENGHVIGEPETGLVAHADHMGEGLRAQIHRHVEAEIAALRDDGGAAVDAGEAMARGPEGDPFHRVQNAVAVRADQGEVAGGLDQPPLQLGPFGPQLGISRGIGDHTARAGMGELAHHLDGSLSRHRQEDGVRRLRQGPYRLEAGDSFDAVQLRADGPDRARKAEGLGLADRLGEVAPANEGQVPGREQALQIPAAAPREFRR